MQDTAARPQGQEAHVNSVSWELTDEEMAATVAKLEQANRRAEAHGLSGRYSWSIDPEYGTQKRYSHLLQGVGSSATYEVQVRTITVTGQVPSFNGWQVVSRISRDTEGVVTYRTEPGFEIDRQAHDDERCDHCHSRRRRITTYVVAHTETGQIKQVGSSCLADFLGILVGPTIIEAIGSLFEDIEAPTYSGGNSADAHPTPVVLAVAAAAVRRYGWTPRSTDNPRAVPTANLVETVLYSSSRHAHELSQELAPTEADHDTARAARAWAQAQDGGTEYLANLKAVVLADNVSARNLGLAVSAVGAYRRAMDAERDHEAAKTSQWVGQVKQRDTYTLTVIGIKTREREAYHYYDHGLSWLVTLADEQGNRFKWFASSEPAFEEGDTVTGKATVKKHDTYRGIKETVFTRCRFEVS